MQHFLIDFINIYRILNFTEFHMEGTSTLYRRIIAIVAIIVLYTLLVEKKSNPPLLQTMLLFQHPKTPKDIKIPKNARSLFPYSVF